MTLSALAPAWTVCVLLAVLSQNLGCSGTYFKGADAAKVEKSEAGGTEQSGKDDDGDLDAEAEVADTPEQVTGAPLTEVVCERMQDPTPSEMVFGCRIETDGEMVSKLSFVANWSVIDAHGAQLSSSDALILELPDDAAWHVQLSLKRALVADARIVADVTAIEGASNGSPIPALYEAPLLSDAPVQAMRVEASNGFRLGDGMDESTSCAAGVQSVQPKGVGLQWDFSVLEANSLVKIGLEGLCGVDYSGLSTLAIWKGNVEVASVELPSDGSTSVALPDVDLAKGDYAVFVQSLGDGEHDDFLVGALWISAGGEIEAADPVPFQ